VAAEKEDAKAQHQLGLVSFSGEGVRQATAAGLE
jgi:TPR repeat protein